MSKKWFSSSRTVLWRQLSQPPTWIPPFWNLLLSRSSCWGVTRKMNMQNIGEKICNSNKNTPGASWITSQRCIFTQKSFTELLTWKITLKYLHWFIITLTFYNQRNIDETFASGHHSGSKMATLWGYLPLDVYYCSLCPYDPPCFSSPLPSFWVLMYFITFLKGTHDQHLISSDSSNIISSK